MTVFLFVDMGVRFLRVGVPVVVLLLLRVDILSVVMIVRDFSMRIFPVLVRGEMMGLQVYFLSESESDGQRTLPGCCRLPAGVVEL